LESLYEIAGEEPIDWLTNNYLWFKYCFRYSAV
jgi:hypothetical protein